MLSKEEIQEFVDEEINPSLEMHDGYLLVKSYDQETNVLEIELGGGCQGCSSSADTLRSAVDGFLKSNFPDISKVVDLTDHTAGTTPHH
tara:strand:+ start:214 stop:480 length:267 start_codon:yes stop_codon:yes gene_type:complete